MHHRADADRLDRRSRLLARGRLTAVIAVLASLALAINARAAGGRWWGSLAVAVVILAVLVVRHARVDIARRRALAMADENSQAVARLDREWLGVPEPPTLVSPTATALDLDVVGPASLLHLVGKAATLIGQRRLEAWALEATVDPGVVLTRQDAIRELAPEVGLRERMACAGRLLPDDARRLDVFLRWVDGPSTSHLRWVPPVAWTLTLALWAASVVVYFSGQALVLWVTTLAAGWLTTLVLGRHINTTFAGAGALAHGLGQFVTLVRLIEGHHPKASLLVSTHARLSVSGATASRALGELDRLIGFSHFRHGALLHVIVHSLTLWDLHVWLALLRWRRCHAEAIPVWLDAVATFDALARLGGLAHLHPEWCYPTFVDEGGVRGHSVGHPLLASRVRVPNDVDIGPAGSVLVVTGSNMAGKSTLLRAVGLNVVLAQLGAPVCAGWFVLPPLRLETCMRTSDSLEHGLSSFMAQLTRLKAVVDAAIAPGPPLLYLLDEVLHGTNSEERRIAVQRILSHLLRTSAIGALTTHDLALTQIPALTLAARHVHFTETFDESVVPPVMRFDYRMRPGPATSRNALKLVAMLGLPEA